MYKKDKNFNYNGNSPAQIRTGVKGSKGLYACPLHSVFNNATGLSGHFIIKFTFIISFTNWSLCTIQACLWDPPLSAIFP